MLGLQNKLNLPSSAEALPGRQQAIELVNSHYVHGRPIQAPFSDNDSELQMVALGLGCFWGAERVFWQLEGVYTTAVGYGAGITPNPSYEEVCSGKTGHNELVLVVYNPIKISFKELLSTFFESHNPTQGMRQGNDRGTQYRSGIYFFSDDLSKQDQAKEVLKYYQQRLSDARMTNITTELKLIENFYYAEQYHQQYLAKNPSGYCGLGGTGIKCGLPE